MKKVFPILLTIALIVIPITGASASQVSPTGPAELQYYDAQIDLMWPRLAAFQSDYYETNGRYYQALESHASAPDVPAIPDNIDESPTDQPEDLALFWEDFAALPDVLAWSFRIDTYTAPDGDGYTLVVETVVNGDTWRKAINYGPASEDWRASDWYQVVPFDFGF